MKNEYKAKNNSLTITINRKENSHMNNYLATEAMMLDIRKEDQLKKIISEMISENPAINTDNLKANISNGNNPSNMLYTDAPTYEQEPFFLELCRKHQNSIVSVTCFSDDNAALKHGVYYVRTPARSKYKRNIIFPHFIIEIKEDQNAQYYCSNMSFGYGGAGPSAIKSILLNLGIPPKMLNIITKYNPEGDKRISKLSYFYSPHEGWNINIDKYITTN